MLFPQQPSACSCTAAGGCCRRSHAGSTPPAQRCWSAPGRHAQAALAAAGAARVGARALAASPHAPPATTATTTALQLARLQGILDDAAPLQPEPAGGDGAAPAAGRHRRPKAAAGFGKSARSAAAAAQPSQQQQQQRAVPKPGDPCPCQSGLAYKACCLPFLMGGVQPKSAPELARARLAAATLGDLSYLVTTTHPDSNLRLGGGRDLARRSRRQVASFREHKFKVVGMAHCCGDADGTWLVLAILQATAGEFAGSKVPVMYSLAQRGSSSSGHSSNSSGSNSGNGSSSGSNSSGGGGSRGSPDEWLYMGQANQLPQHEGVEALYQLLQAHVPESLRGGDGDGGGAGGDVAARQLCFVWDTPNLGLPTAPETAAATAAGAAAAGSGSSGSGSAGAWYVDLLRPEVESLGGLGGQAGAAGAGLLPSGVFSMDAYVEARQQQQQQRRGKAA